MENKTQDSLLTEIKSVSDLQGQLVVILLRVIAVIGFLAAISGTIDTLQSETDEFWPIFLYWGSYLVILILNIWKIVSRQLKSWVIVVLLYFLGMSNFFDEGINGRSQAIFIAMVVLTGMLLGRRASQFVIVINFFTMLSFAILYTNGLLVDPFSSRSQFVGEWIVAIVVVMALSILLMVSLDFLIPQLISALNHSNDLTNKLSTQRDNLEKQVNERTAELERRNRQLANASQIAREVSTIQDLDELLSESVKLISKNFNFYHAGIFLNDETNTFAVLRSASSEGGERLLAQGHRLRIGEIGIVGYVTDRGLPRISLDVGNDAVFFNNPDLPNTRSEMALPLRVRGQILGALDIQSTHPNAFFSDDIAIMQTLADQLALAINTARLLQEIQTRLAETQRAYGEISQEAWQKYLVGQNQLSERYDPSGILPFGQIWSDEMKKAALQKKHVLNEDSANPSLAIPILERGKVIGVINALKSENKGRWNPDEISLMEAITDQLGTALDSARSYQDTRLAAIREQKTSDATARVRATLDIETIVKTATEEIRQALNLPEVTIQIGPPDTPLGNGS